MDGRPGLQWAKNKPDIAAGFAGRRAVRSLSSGDTLPATQGPAHLTQQVQMAVDDDGKPCETVNGTELDVPGHVQSSRFRCLGERL